MYIRLFAVVLVVLGLGPVLWALLPQNESQGAGSMALKSLLEEDPEQAKQPCSPSTSGTQPVDACPEVPGLLPPHVGPMYTDSPYIQSQRVRISGLEFTMRVPDPMTEEATANDSAKMLFVARIFELLRRDGKEAGLIVDIGSNTGIYSLMASVSGLTVIAVDPQIDCLLSVQLSAYLSSIPCPLLLHAAASSKSHGQVFKMPRHLLCSPDFGGPQRPAQAPQLFPWPSPESKWHPNEAREIASFHALVFSRYPPPFSLNISRVLQSLCVSAASQRCSCAVDGARSTAAKVVDFPKVSGFPLVSWMKIDVEGSEYDVLESAEALFAAHAIARLQVELSPMFWRIDAAGDMQAPKIQRLLSVVLRIHGYGYVSCCLNMCPTGNSSGPGDGGHLSLKTWGAVRLRQYYENFAVVGRQSDFYFTLDEAELRSYC